MTLLAALIPLLPMLGTLIPQIASWIGGDDAEDVARQVTGVVTAVAGGTSEAAVSAALADPSQRAALIEQLARIAAEREKQRDMAITERLKAGLADVANARMQTVSLAQSGSRIAWAPVVISAIIVLGFFGCVFALFFANIKMDERMATIANQLFGAMTLAFGQAYNYWLGSSRERAAESDRAAQAVEAVSRVTSDANSMVREAQNTATATVAAAATAAAVAANTPISDPVTGRLYRRD